jgi:hypothetical protein
MGHPEFVIGFKKGWLGFMVSHPSRKNKSAARVGHPEFVIDFKKAGWGPWYPTLPAKTR